jgi:hypothetical protein
MNKTRCPICQQAMPGLAKEWPDYPFCCKRCRRVDLGRWLGEGYRIPAEESGDDQSTDSAS